MGFFTSSDGICKDLLHYSQNDPRLNIIDGDTCVLYASLIEHFSAVGSTVLDMTTDDMKGTDNLLKNTVWNFLISA